MPSLIKTGQKPGGTGQWGPGGTGEELERGQQEQRGWQGTLQAKGQLGTPGGGHQDKTACFEKWAEQGWVWRPQKRKRNWGFGKS